MAPLLREVGRFKRGNHQYDVILQVPSAGRASHATRAEGGTTHSSVSNGRSSTWG